MERGCAQIMYVTLFYGIFYPLPDNLQQGRLLGDANDVFASGPPAQEALKVKPTGENYASCGKKWSKYGQNYVSRGEKRSKFCFRR